jgi:hypothetical protein
MNSEMSLSRSRDTGDLAHFGGEVLAVSKALFRDCWKTFSRIKTVSDGTVVAAYLVTNVGFNVGLKTFSELDRKIWDSDIPREGVSS